MWAASWGALRRPPAGAPKSVCLEPVQRTRGPRPPAPENASLEVRDLRLDDVDVDLAFPMWGLTLTRAHGTGSLAFGTPGGAGFTFDVRDATAPVGELRIGPSGTRATTTARFDSVLLSHVGVSREEPSDIVLEVGRADTERSRLSGKATFVNVFARHGRRGEKNPPGLVLDARWDRLHDAMAQLRAPWLPRDALGEVLEGALVARMRGNFNALTGTLSIDGQRLGLEASIEESRRATLDARVTDLAITPFLHESLATLLGGRITGRLHATLGRGTDGADLEIPSADVVLVRDGATPAPRELAFRVGAAARSAPTRADVDTLSLGLTSASLRSRALRLEGLSAKWAELSAHGALTLIMPARTSDAPAAPARLDATLTAGVTSLARWVSPKDLLGARVRAAGPSRGRSITSTRAWPSRPPRPPRSSASASGCPPRSRRISTTAARSRSTASRSSASAAAGWPRVGASCVTDRSRAPFACRAIPSPGYPASGASAFLRRSADARRPCARRSRAAPTPRSRSRAAWLALPSRGPSPSRTSRSLADASATETSASARGSRRSPSTARWGHPSRSTSARPGGPRASRRTPT